MACFFASFQSTFPFPQPSSWEDSAPYFTKPAPSLTTNYHQDTDLFSCHVLGSSYMREKSFQITLLRSDGDACCQWEKGMLHTLTITFTHEWLDKWAILLGSPKSSLFLSKTAHAQNPCALRTVSVSSRGSDIQLLWIITSDILMKSLKTIIYSFNW